MRQRPPSPSSQLSESLEFVERTGFEGQIEPAIQPIEIVRGADHRFQVGGNAASKSPLQSQALPADSEIVMPEAWIWWVTHSAAAAASPPR